MARITAHERHTQRVSFSKGSVLEIVVPGVSDFDAEAHARAAISNEQPRLRPRELLLFGESAFIAPLPSFGQQPRAKL